MAIASGSTRLVLSLEAIFQLALIINLIDTLYVLIIMFESDGQMTQIFFKAVDRFKQLKAFSASTNRMPSVCDRLKTDCIATSRLTCTKL